MATKYCSETDIGSRYKSTVFSSSSSITTDELTLMIELASATINGRINSKYVTPVTTPAPEALLVLKRICIFLVTAEVDEIIRNGALKTSSTKNTEETRISRFARQADQMLKDIENGILELTDATLRESATIESFNNDNSIEFTLDKEKEQW